MRGHVHAIVGGVALAALAVGTAAAVRSQHTDVPAQATPVAAVRAPLLADLAQPMDPIRLRPVDPTTLADMPDLVPIEVGHHYTSGLSPDGRTLAVISWPNGSNNAGASLLLIDLSTWTVRSTGAVINDSVLGPFYSSDGAALWWANPGWHDRTHGMPRGYSLVRYDLASGQLATVFTFAESFAPWQI